MNVITELRDSALRLDDLHRFHTRGDSVLYNFAYPPHHNRMTQADRHPRHIPSAALDAYLLDKVAQSNVFSWISFNLTFRVSVSIYSLDKFHAVSNWSKPFIEFHNKPKAQRKHSRFVSPVQTVVLC